MQQRRLGRTSTEVSVIGLGTMTFGEQNTEAEAHSQLDYAVERGVNFIDTAEMYAVPARPETQGLTEQYIGSWLRKRGDREGLIIATKVTGPADWAGHIRGGPKLTQSHIEAALNGSLKRLQTEYIDLYQVHWPARDTNYFGKLGYQHNHNDATPIEETLTVLAEFVKRGKIRYVGVSNETPWGVMEYLRLAAQQELPRIVSIQNPYSLLNRTFEIGLAEMAVREQVSLLAYSPLGFGVLTGKYLGGHEPPGARLTLFKQFDRYSNNQAAENATRAYVELAKAHGLSPVQMALAFVNTRDFLTSTIIGATNCDQLRENLDSANAVLTKEVLSDIEEIHRRHPNPCP